MNNNLIVSEKELSIEKNFKKYILEVDDAIEAHGFKTTSYIDYAEDSILKIQDSTKAHFKKYGSSLLFTNLLETSLNSVATDITNITLENELNKTNDFQIQKLNEKINNLHEDLQFLNSRLLNSFKDF